MKPTGRRTALRALLGMIALPALALRRAHAQEVLPAHDIKPLIAAITGGKPVQRGRVFLELPELADNAQSVTLKVGMPGSMTSALYTRSVHLFAERNPRPNVANYFFTPQSGRAEVLTRVRLAATQKVTALAALSDGTFWTTDREIVVTSAACLDDSFVPGQPS